MTNDTLYVNDALYVYGIVKSEPIGNWHVSDDVSGLNGNNLEMYSGGNFSAIVHRCEERPYLSEDPEAIKKLIIEHNMVLNKAMEKCGGVMPLCFNTIIKTGEGTAEMNLKQWLTSEEKRLESIWNKIKGKKEYGLRIYFERTKFIEEISAYEEIEVMRQQQKGISKGLHYLQESKIASRIKEITYDKINHIKQELYDYLKTLVWDLKVNLSRIAIKEEKDLLLSLSVLISDEQRNEVEEELKKKVGNCFSFHIAGPFAPYSFIEDFE